MTTSIQSQIDALLRSEADARRAARDAANEDAAGRLIIEAERYADAAWSLGEHEGVAYVPSGLWSRRH
jgi:hypothetical protein